MLIPFRKCYYFSKPIVLTLLVILLLRTLSAWDAVYKLFVYNFKTFSEESYEMSILDDEARIIPGLGEGGEAVYLKGMGKILGKQSLRQNAMNTYLSDRLPYFRKIRDVRHQACSRIEYDATLPSTSVVIIFHNEPYSTLVRTVISVLETVRRDDPLYWKAKFKDSAGRHMALGYSGQNLSSTYLYIREIILVDDASTLPELQGKLEYYMKTRVGKMVKIIRVPKRKGLTRARWTGARVASSDVIVFLDAHCEPTPDWLRPLLQRLKDKNDTALVPVIESVHAYSFKYYAGDTAVVQGLTAARLAGARAARGDVLVFLDAHCEPGPDWLRPMLQRLKHKSDTAVTPIIDVINEETFKMEAAEGYQVGGFNWAGHFTWIDVPQREVLRRSSLVDPTWSPTMAGGLFAINRRYFWEVGAYDEQMAGWGGENLELSFRVWMCGGTLETIPCSRIGHVFRSFHPYGMPAQSDTHGINTARLAEVWMDDYKELYYIHRPDLKNSPKIGDITHRKVLREKLRCNSFQWYLDNIYPEKFVPIRDTIAYGRFESQTRCLDKLGRENTGFALGVYTCYDERLTSQIFALTTQGIIREDEKCAEVDYEGFKSHSHCLDNLRRDRDGFALGLYGCYGERVTTQTFALTTQGILRGEEKCAEVDYKGLKNPSQNLCLDTRQREQSGAAVGVYACHEHLSISQMYSISLSGIIRVEDNCGEVRYHGKNRIEIEEGLTINMYNCGRLKKDQTWTYLPTKQLKHTGSGLCLDARDREDAAVRPCSPEATQQWVLEFHEMGDFASFDKQSDPERDAAFARIRATRRNATQLRGIRSDKTF